MKLIPVILAGESSGGPFASLRIPKLGLPVSRTTTLLDEQLQFVESFVPDEVCRILVGDQSAALKYGDEMKVRDWELRIDQGPHRGTAGVLADSMNAETGFDEDTGFLIVEASVFPDMDISELLARFNSHDFELGLGVDSHGHMAGVMVLTQAVLDLVPSVGYFDLKEQLTAAAVAAGFRLGAVEVVARSRKLRNLEDWISLIRTTGASTGDDPGSSVEEHSVIADDVVVDNGMIFDSVVLGGARVGAGAIVARSIIGRDVVIGPGMVVIDSVIGRHLGKIDSASIDVPEKAVTESPA